MGTELPGKICLDKKMNLVVPVIEQTMKRNSADRRRIAGTPGRLVYTGQRSESISTLPGLRSVFYPVGRV